MRNMPIKVKGYRPTKISCPTGPIADPVQTRRNNFLKGLRIEVVLLEGEGQYEEQFLYGNDLKPNVRQWWWTTSDGYQTDLQYEDKILTAEGQGYKFPDKQGLRGFYNDVEEQCKNGDFDEALEEAGTPRRAIQV